MRNVVMRQPLAKKARLVQEADVFTPVAIGELVPRPANLLARLRKSLGGGEPVAGGQLLRNLHWLPIALRRNHPGVRALGKERLRRRERHDVDVATAETAMGERELERLAGKSEVMLDPRDALFLERKENPVRRAHADRGVMTEVNSKCESVVHKLRSV